MDNQRLFIAINLNADTKKELIALQNAVSSNSKHGNFTLQDNLHLTLAFLGDCTPAQTQAAKAAMDKVNFDPFDLTIDRIGRFKRDGGDIWWAGISESPQMLDLHRQLTTALSAQGFQLETRKFTPHITLSRKVITNTAPWQIKPFGEKAHSIHLMKSERISGVLTYTSIYVRGKKLNPIVVLPYDPTWPAQFEQIKAYLMPHIGHLIVDIHHVGSTSVPGLAAKPIIDFDIEIPSMDSFPAIKQQLAKIGYKHQGDYGIAGREVFKRETPDSFMEHHMYVCPTSSEELKRHIKLRSYLRANPAAAEEYGQLKAKNAQKYGNDIDAYINAKESFILNALASAK